MSGQDGTSLRRGLPGCPVGPGASLPTLETRQRHWDQPLPSESGGRAGRAQLVGGSAVPAGGWARPLEDGGLLGLPGGAERRVVGGEESLARRDKSSVVGNEATGWVGTTFGAS